MKDTLIIGDRFEEVLLAAVSHREAIQYKSQDRDGSKYPFAYRDSEGNYLSGTSSYKLTLPANFPAANFWSITLYDASNSSGLDNFQPYPSIGSLNDLKYNEDKSVDLYFAPELPNNVPEFNWLKTVPGKMNRIRLMQLTVGEVLKNSKPFQVQMI